MKKYLFLSLLFLVIVAITLYGIYSVYSITVDPLRIGCMTYTLPTQDSKLSGLKIVIVSDLHLRENYPDLKILTHLVDSINAQNADFCFLLGDYIDGRIGHHLSLEQHLVDEFSRIQTKRGIYAVLGNHDWYYGPIKILTLFKKINIRVLRNEWITDDGFYIVGVDDYLFGAQNLSRAFQGMPHDARPCFLLTHHPNGGLSLERPVDLVVAGHTHGGQLIPPFFTKPFYCESLIRIYPRGHFNLQHAPMVVTSGVGNSILNFRMRVKPEFVVILFEMGK